MRPPEVLAGIEHYDLAGHRGAFKNKAHGARDLVGIDRAGERQELVLALEANHPIIPEQTEAVAKWIGGFLKLAK